MRLCVKPGEVDPQEIAVIKSSVIWLTPVAFDNDASVKRNNGERRLGFVGTSHIQPPSQSHLVQAFASVSGVSIPPDEATYESCEFKALTNGETAFLFGWRDVYFDPQTKQMAYPDVSPNGNHDGTAFVGQVMSLGAACKMLPNEGQRTCLRRNLLAALKRNGFDVVNRKSKDVFEFPVIRDIRGCFIVPERGDEVVNPRTADIVWSFHGFRDMDSRKTSLGSVEAKRAHAEDIVADQTFFVGKKLRPVAALGWPSFVKNRMWPDKTLGAGSK